MGSILLALYLTPDKRGAIPLRGAHDGELVAALIAGLLLWLLLAWGMFSRFTSARHANTGVYAELHERLAWLDARLSVLCPPTETTRTPIECIACGEVETHRKVIVEELDIKGLPWVMATGYVGLLTRVHRAEEALIEVEPREQVIGGALYDHLRLQGSDIDNNRRLLHDIELATAVLDPSALWFFTHPPTGTQVVGAANDRSNGVPPAPKPVESGSHADVRARAVLRSVRRTVNEYRDDRRAGLVRVRNRLIKTVIFTQLTATVLLALTMVWGASLQAIAAAAAFYVVGALIGLFSRLRNDSESQGDIEDYGLSTARLMHTPLFSGLAAIGGVLLFGALGSVLSLPAVTNPTTGAPPAATAPAPTPTNTTPGAQLSGLPPSRETVLLGTRLQGATPAQGTAGASRSIPNLNTIFSPTALNLIVAAFFGLTPTLLIARLQQADRYIKELRSTEAPNRATVGG